MLLKELKKNAEFTYGVHSAVLAEVVADNAFTLMEPNTVTNVLKHLDQGVMGSVRALNARLQLLRQAIGYGLTYKVDSSTHYPIEGVDSIGPRLLFAVYKRNKTNNEGQLTMKLSLGAGGHVEGDDLSYHVLRSENSDEVVTTPAIDILETIDDSYLREYVEEVLLESLDGHDMSEAVLGASKAMGYQKLGFVMDSQEDNPGYVGNIHFGVVYALEAPNDVACFEMREPQNDAVAWASVKDLHGGMLLGYELIEFEPWSALIIEQLKAVEAHILSYFHGVKSINVDVDPADHTDKQSI